MDLFRNQYTPGPLAQEYAEKVVPLSQSYAKTAQVFEMPIKVKHMEPYEEDALAKAIFQMIEVLKNVESIKKQLAMRSDFNL